MKKMFLVALSVMTFSAAAFAADAAGIRSGGYGMGGCGLGSVIFEKNTKTHQILASTTNATFGSTTFGITSGTSNCTGGGVAKIDKEQEMFVEANFETLNEEMAQGKGETLYAFANLMGCNNASAFGKFTQTKYGSVFSKASTPEALLIAVESELATGGVGHCQL